MCTHSFNIRHQYVRCKNKKESLAVDEVLLHVDFAENWVYKGLHQIQSAHFGGSNAQVTLHTGVAYVGETRSPISLYSISADNAHHPPTNWAHLQPVLEMLTNNHLQMTD